MTRVFLQMFRKELELVEHGRCIHIQERPGQATGRSVCLSVISPIDLVTVFDAILTSRQTREKLQCLYENLMSNNFRRTTVLKKI